MKKSKVKYRKKIDIKIAEALEKLKADYEIYYEIMSDDEILEYKRKWVDKFLPKNATSAVRKEAYDACLSNNTFLWHIFSYRFINSMENPTEQFEKIKKYSCVLLFEADETYAVRLENAIKLTEKDIIDFCKSTAGWCDFVITDEKFSWTYSRTHEDGWLGPYFFRKGDNYD